MAHFNLTTNKNQINKKLINELKKICKQFKVKPNFKLVYNTLDYGGHCEPHTGKIWVRYNHKMRKSVLISIVFHEIAHVENFKNKKFYAYHTMGMYPELTNDHIKKIIRTALKAELYTDKVGELLMKRHYPKLKYKGLYKYKVVQDTFKTYFISFWRQKLEINNWTKEMFKGNI